MLIYQQFLTSRFSPPARPRLPSVLTPLHIATTPAGVMVGDNVDDCKFLVHRLRPSHANLTAPFSLLFQLEISSRRQLMMG